MLLCSFFIQLRASDRDDISVAGFIGSFTGRFCGAPFALPPLSAPSENIVTIHSRRISRSLGSISLSTLCEQLQGGGSEGLVRTFNVHDPDHILMHDGVFCPVSRKTGEVLRFDNGVSVQRVSSDRCTREVVIYEYEGRKVCIKRWPEAPGIEITAYQIYQSIFQESDADIPLPAAEMILIDGQVFLVLNFMDGEPFSDVLLETTAPRRVFNLEKFQKLALFSLLVMPNDAGARNLLLKKIPDSNEWFFQSIDNERGFLEPFTGDFDHPTKGIIRTSCHSDVLFFYEMLAHPLTESVLRTVMTSKSNILSTWQRIIEENRYQLALKHQTIESDTILGIAVNEDAIISMLARVNTFIRLMSIDAGRARSLASIFGEVCPELAVIYRIPTDMPVPVSLEATDLNDVLKRIYDVEPGRAPGAIAPASTYFPVYNGSTNITLPMVHRILTWVRGHCDTLSERERTDTDIAIGAIQATMTIQPIVAAVTQILAGPPATAESTVQSVAAAIIPDLQRTAIDFLVGFLSKR